MCMDSVFGGRHEDDAHQPGMDEVTAIAEWSRVDLLRVTGVRIWPGRPNRGGVFSELAAVSVPALRDEMVIQITEAGTHRYRIRRPGHGHSEPLGEAAFPSLTAVPPDPAPGRPGEVTVAGRTVAVMVGSLPGGGPEYRTAGWSAPGAPGSCRPRWTPRWSGCRSITPRRWCTQNAPPAG